MKNKKCCQGALQRELATAFTWDDVKTESALLYRPHSVRLIAAALYRPKDKSDGVTRRMCCGCNLHERWIYFMFMKLYWSSSAGDKATIASACMHVLCVCVCVCVCESNWLITSRLELLIAPHLKMITCCRCRWQQQWCTPRFCFDVCGQGRAAGLTGPNRGDTRNACKYMRHFLFSVKRTSAQRFYANNAECVMS